MDLILQAARRMLTRAGSFFKDEDGMGTVEVILIIVDIYIRKRCVYSVFCIP